VDGKLLQEQYVLHLSDFLTWDQHSHADDWILFPDNTGAHLSIDEVALSQGELYTVLTNKAAHGKKGALVAMIKGTESEKVISVLNRIPISKRNRVKEITLDMAGTMEKIARKSFPKAIRVTDRFHVQKLVYEAVQDLRIDHRWKALELENQEIEFCRENNKEYIPQILENGDTLKQLLVRSRYLLFKAESKWTPTQYQRAQILFRYYPDLEQAYKLAMQLGAIFHQTTQKEVALTKLARWYDRVEQSGIKFFNTAMNSIQNHYRTILNFFNNRATNASAESFNAKIKAFRAQFRGVKDRTFFLYRLAKIYA
jgi:transposase